MHAQQLAANEKFYQALLTRYTVTIDDPKTGSDKTTVIPE
jgi:hypothetical protein